MMEKRHWTLLSTPMDLFGSLLEVIKRAIFYSNTKKIHGNVIKLWPQK